MILGPLTLYEYLILDGLESDPPIAFSARPTIGAGGVTIIQSIPLGGSRELTLSGEGAFTFSNIKDIQELARKNQPLTMNHPRGNFTVLITGIEPEPFWNVADPESGDRYSAVISLLEM